MGETGPSAERPSARSVSGRPGGGRAGAGAGNVVGHLECRPATDGRERAGRGQWLQVLAAGDVGVEHDHLTAGRLQELPHQRAAARFHP